MSTKQLKGPIKILGTPFIVDFSSLIGKGSFGSVYHAYNTENRDQKICCKVTQLNEGVIFEYLRKESMILERLQPNNNLVQIIKPIVHSQDKELIFMEYCDGGNLQDYITYNGTFSEVEIILFLQQFIAGYIELNQQQIIHCDLKPANILLHKGTYKIADFGISQKLMFKDQYVNSRGTFDTMAPELFQKEYRDERYKSQKNRSKVDMFSLGCILYNMIYPEQGHPYLGNMNELPKIGDTRNQKLGKLINQNDIVIFQDSVRVISQELKDLVSGLVDKNIDKRLALSDLVNNEYIFPPQQNSFSNIIQESIVDQDRRASIFESSRISTLLTSPNINITSFFNKKELVIKQKRESMIISQPILEDSSIQRENLFLEIENIKKQTGNKQELTQKIEIISRKCQFLREIAYFHDKCAMYVYGLNGLLKRQINKITSQQLQQQKNEKALENLEKQKIELQITIEKIDQIIQFILKRGIHKTNNIINDLLFSREEVQEFKNSEEYCKLMILTQQDTNGMNQFETSLLNEAQNKLKDENENEQNFHMQNQFLQTDENKLKSDIIFVFFKFSSIYEYIEKDFIRPFLISFLYLSQMIAIIKGSSQFFTSKFEDNPTIQFLRYYECIESTILSDYIERLQTKVIAALESENIRIILSID